MPHQNTNQLTILKKINDSLDYRMFKWYELGILGCAGKPFIDMSPWIDMDCDSAKHVYAEITQNLPNLRSIRQPYTGSYIPEDVNHQKFVNYYIWNAEKHIPDINMQQFKTVGNVANWVCSQGIVPYSWNAMYYIMATASNKVYTTGDLLSDLQEDGIWGADFPLLDAWIKSWGIFQQITRIVAFQNMPGNPVMIHRDTNFRVPQTHQVSLQFKKGRRGFIYDELLKEKIYYNTQAYTFNTADLHGVDAEDDTEFTIRIDGKFNLDTCSRLGFIDGLPWTFTPSRLAGIKIYEPNERP